MVQNTDLTFFTNEPERDLYSRFSKILKSNTQFFDVLVGYFRTSGFFKMYDAMETVEKIRILVGLNVDKYTVKIIDKANAEIKYEAPTMKEAKESFSENVENEFAQSDTTSQIEQGVRTFIEWLKNGKLEMRMYVDAPIHAKVYIIDGKSFTIPIMKPEEYKILLKICEGSTRMAQYSKCYTGEIDLSLNKKYIHFEDTYSRMLRGAQVQKFYTTDNISQGDILFLDSELYLHENSTPRSKHHNEQRIVMQDFLSIL